MPPILVPWPMMAEADVGEVELVTVEVELPHQDSVLFCCCASGYFG